MKNIFLYIVLFFSVTSLSAQVNNYEQLKLSLEKFNNKSLNEKIFVHTDKDAYLAGEIMWYKLYYIDGYFNKPLNVSNVAYVELLDQALEPVFRAKVSLDPKESNGSIHLPLHLGSGIYQLKVYTNYMKNFGEDLFFEKQIAIYNTFSSDTAVVADIQAGYAVNLYPEGGVLLAGIENNLAYQVVNEIGKGVANEVWLTRNAKDTIAHVKSNALGMQKLVFTPEKDQQYHLIVKLESGEQILQAVRGIEATGSNLRLTDKGNDLEIKVQNIGAANNFRARLVNLLITSNRLPVKELKGNFQNGEAVFVVSKNDLKDGINVISAINDFGQPLSERLFFKVPASKLELEVTTNQTVLDTRSLLKLDINTANGKDVNSSLSIYRIDSLFQVDESDIFQYLWLSGELKGVVENPGHYFNTSSKDIHQQIDLLMLVNGWRRFNWSDLAISDFKYVPEVVGQIVYGKLINSVSKQPIANKTISYSLPGKYYKIGTAMTDSLGDFSFILKDVYGVNDIYLQVLDMTDKNYEFIVSENFINEHESPFSRKFSYSTAGNLDMLEEYHVGNQTYNIYYADKIREYNVVKALDTIPFFQKPMYSYILDNYTRFNTMEEVLREFVLPVNVYTKNKELRIGIINTIYKEPHRENVLTMIDGLVIQNDTEVFALDPLLFEKVEVLSRAYVHGMGYYNGIVNFKSYNGDLGGYVLPEIVKVVNYEGLQKYRTFYHPVYQSKEAKESRLPDYRHTMYWNPSVEINAGTSKSIDIYTSDLKGKYVGIIQGLDKEGKAGSYKFYFEVK
ncbi:hypothetical protein [Gynurincola endophyticus]|uniref:hypothetical protein n=1 Tax=Gynurincola endophyticus TaxID=2479004 RepID=UPI000F8EABD9|nr:hypothetical protein [Gynurincola endophyticus]